LCTTTHETLTLSNCFLSLSKSNAVCVQQPTKLWHYPAVFFVYRNQMLLVYNNPRNFDIIQLFSLFIEIKCCLYTTTHETLTLSNCFLCLSKSNAVCIQQPTKLWHYPAVFFVYRNQMLFVYNNPRNFDISQLFSLFIEIKCCLYTTTHET
jgi:hypothetical protein